MFGPDLIIRTLSGAHLASGSEAIQSTFGSNSLLDLY